LAKDDVKDEMYHSPVYNTEDKHYLLAALEEQCHLTMLLTDLVSLIFAPRVASTASLASTEAFSALMTTIENVKEPLVQWEMQA
jgi:hypothetical protein